MIIFNLNQLGSVIFLGAATVDRLGRWLGMCCIPQARNFY